MRNPFVNRFDLLLGNGRPFRLRAKHLFGNSLLRESAIDAFK
jgi:hypothetical protein